MVSNQLSPTHHSYRAKHVLHGDTWLNNALVTICDDGTITAIEPFNHQQHSDFIDLGEVSLMPGMIDTHVHGAQGCDVMDACHASLNTMSQYFASLGVTGFVATTVTAPVNKIRSALKQVAKSMKQGVNGAEILGAYLEGPYFTEKNKGAHPTAWFRDLSVEELDNWISYADNHLVTVALAPEKAGAIEAIRYLRQQGIKVMLGHTDASYDQVQQALNAGANGIVHCYNGMRGLHHRDPGVVGAGLLHFNSYVEMIADGHHVHPAAIDVAHLCCGNRLTLITDAMSATGMPNGEYVLGEYTVYMKDGVVTTDAGGLAGSTLTMPHAVQNIQQWLDLPLEQAWLMASLTPAKSLGLQDQLGSLEVGKRASMVAITSDLSIVKTWVDGRLVFKAQQPSQEALCI
ncbi:N-acetylglucosamine-6-phosphate deacetylase [Photobacterium angustum]|uniref:N-acetylglucosamine-6-phosphate deacetylase n=1 Tax=Photobacterium angustum TaxID=661 RepID=UPI0005E71A06|nr:N-acetylglucosamine-6-phosphate deacetylase [Photobacterium angustum]KJG17009.1 N-acetylglucosamine-6-phosphate deacetylase [Photobacterium angustum]KJG24299.1 N-acetylglucosamine-6-phosphate deacetylase [Photobacterium angustum]KJG31901.1 N-acetylglucosamine-6-phosphate deacetylase [Photobacterium angustum]PSW96863.1 N-acetylglucosamine-6-phosphate deacetylase [Photobacterium angustum]PSX03732.1 N-acetylglucosamine-6-phosphate deacetylase [Photobacterium angustum]